MRETGLNTETGEIVLAEKCLVVDKQGKQILDEPSGVPLIDAGVKDVPVHLTDERSAEGDHRDDNSMHFTEEDELNQ